MAENEAARRTAEPVVVSNSPDVCLTGGAPVPYSIVAYFPPSIQLAETVLFTEDPAFTIVSSIPGVIGDEAGDGGGVVSGVHAGGAYTHVVTGSQVYRVEAVDSQQCVSPERHVTAGYVLGGAVVEHNVGGASRSSCHALGDPRIVGWDDVRSSGTDGV